MEVIKQIPLLVMGFLLGCFVGVPVWQIIDRSVREVIHTVFKVGHSRDYRDGFSDGLASAIRESKSK